MKRERSTKVVATLGPASDTENKIRELFEAGADIFRLNLSHGDHEAVRQRHQKIRRIEEEVGRPIGILADLQGPKIRCGTFARGSEMLVRGQEFRFDSEDIPGDKSRVHVPVEAVFSAMTPGASILVNDGQIRLEVNEAGQDFARCRVIEGGRISDRKGINLPDVVLPLAALSDKDRDDLEFVCELGIDWLALSFVQRAGDIEEARQLANGRAAIMAKIEKPAALECFDSILDASDGIMVARGDLGVEMSVHEVPPVQKRLIRRCRAAAKPVIVATQMLESMITSPVPTRAEVSDVAQAVYEGADAIMLSAESAAGKHPTASVHMMHNVALSVERDPTFRQIMEASRTGIRETVTDAMTVAAREIAETTEVKAICCFTHSGTTGRLISRERPKRPLLILTPFPEIARRLCLLWGSHCVVTKPIDSFGEAVLDAATIARREEFGEKDDRVIILAGVPFNVPGSTNIIRIAELQSCEDGTA
ncbi:MAG: pyruvate kinase [Rhodobacteraceae bacterium]|nr:pyruvate kinase [Paracoccaceae bacterium]MCY4197980.1 pyruvate kinase [Paracoccaceae bacterium]MCY4326352.1 pyruvate kinase [Paracoccaceae bacterium]